VAQPLCLRCSSLQDVAKHVANVCAILGESPIVRYQGSSDSMKGLAALVQQRLNELRPYKCVLAAPPVQPALTLHWRTPCQRRF